MAKSKSSASSGTRKKHARRAAATHGGPEEISFPKEKKPKKEKGSKKGKEPRKKVYIPPSKPAPHPDPLDTLGIAQRIPPELHVVLRKLAKKDSTTKRRALEDLQTDWVEKSRADGSVAQALVESLPVWFHHLPSLFIHPSRRIRLLAVGLHASLLNSASPIPEQAFFYLQEVADADQTESILGTWRMAAHDLDRQVANYARQSWDKFISVSFASSESEAINQQHIATAKRLKLLVDSSSFSRLVSFVQRVLLDPGGVYLYFNPPHYAPAPLPPHAKAAKSRPSPKKEHELGARAKPEEEEEKEEDRNARLRSSAFGAGEWVLSKYSESGQSEKDTAEFLSQFDNELLWSALYHGKTAPFTSELSALGYEQPGVRRSAWSFLQVLLRTFKGHLQSLLPLLSSAVLRSAWVEPAAVVRNTMWPPLLTFLKEFPTAWELDAAPKEEEDEDDSDDEENTSKPKTAPAVSYAFQEFLQFLELYCADSPLQGYPAILIILSTVPPFIFSTVKDPLQTVFTSFWAAVDGRAFSGLDRLTTSAAFLSSILESMVFMIRRLGNDKFAPLLSSEEPAVATKSLIEEQIGRAWEELSSGKLKVDTDVAAKTFAKTLLSLEQLNASNFVTAWDKLASLIKAESTSTNASTPSLIPTTLKVFQRELDGKSCVNELIHEVVGSVITELEGVLGNSEIQVSSERFSSLITILDAFGTELFEDNELASAVDDAMLRHTSRLLSLSLPLVLVYLFNRKDENLIQKVWNAVLSAVASAEPFATALNPLLEIAEKKELPAILRPESDPLDKPIGQFTARSLTQDFAEVSVLEKLLKYPDHFISPECYKGLISTLVETFSAHSQNTMYDDQIPLATFPTSLRLLRVLPKQNDCISLLPDLFDFAFLVPEFRDVDLPLRSSATELWHSIMSHADKEGVSITIRERIKTYLSDTSCLASPTQVLYICQAHKDEILVEDIETLIHPEILNELLSKLPDCPSNSSLAVTDPLVPVATTGDDDEDELSESEQFVFDRSGYSSYGRLVIALVHYFLDNRQLAKTTIWPFRHFLALTLYADEKLQLPDGNNPVFARHVPSAVLQDLQLKIQQLVTYVFSSVPDQFLCQTIPTLLESGSPTVEGIGGLLHQLIHIPNQKGTIRESRGLHIILRHLLSSATKDDADKLLAVARKLEKIAPQASLAINLSITESGLEPAGLERYRNQLAADLTGIRPAKVNTEGLWSLRRLNMAAPDPDSDVVFLPTPRAVNLVKACQQWIESDEDVNEAVESELTLVFINLAPIIQNVVGSHWDFIFDVLENNLENCSFDSVATLPTLSRSLRLLLTIQDLAVTNKQLREPWHERQQGVLTLVRDLVAVKLEKSNTSGPLSTCREQALIIVQDLPSSLIDHETLSKMCHLVVDSSSDVQTMAYTMLREAAAKRTEHIVVEAAVETETEFKAELPLELIELLQQSLQHAEETTASQNILGSLLSWSLAFDLFTDASLKVKSGYIEHLRQLQLISDHFLPEVFSILGLYEGVAKAFKLDIWSIEEFYLDLYSQQAPISLSLLAAHLYYRALKVVPSLFRSWLLDCRDRQLSAAVTAYTSNYFSPALIRAELAQVKDPSAAADLKDDNLTVKVANAVNEVTAAYAVDEYKLELKLKLPADWPLHNIEVKDSSRVGVTEDRWRAWILGVQQILSFRSGSIIDGIGFFKKNVTSHFEGQSECAICYSVISAMDGSLPKKPCKTCKNRFHAGCLYKWFSTSHSPTCPLCRSEIM